MRLLAFIIALFCLLPATAEAQWLPGQATEAVREGLEIGTSTSEIAITSDFHGADLTGVNLSGAHLAKADFSAATLDKANLNGADLTSANFDGASLKGATIDGVTWSATTCPDGKISDDVGGTCGAHLEAKTP